MSHRIVEPAASGMTSEQINVELDILCERWKSFRSDCDGMSGSPGEWMSERIDELETELKRRQS